MVGWWRRRWEKGGVVSSGGVIESILLMVLLRILETFYNDLLLKNTEWTDHPTAGQTHHLTAGQTHHLKEMRGRIYTVSIS